VVKAKNREVGELAGGLGNHENEKAALPVQPENGSKFTSFLFIYFSHSRSA
jgi:hypothetical protein